MRRSLLSLVFILLATAASSAGQVDALLESLNPTGHVNDFAAVAGAQRQPIELLLTELEQKTGAEVAVVTVNTLDGQDISDFATRLFERWGIGQADQDNGVLLIAAIADRSVWIEVGYGLEPVINDALAGRVLDQAVVPYFRNNDYPSGLASGAASLATLIADDAGVELTGTIANVPVRNGTGPGGPLSGVLRIIFIVAALLLFWKNPWLALLLLSSGRGGFGGGAGGGFGRGGGGGFGGFGGGMSGGGGAGRSW